MPDFKSNKLRRRPPMVDRVSGWRMLLAVCCCFLMTPLYAAGRHFLFPPGSSLRFRHITIDDGLAQSSVDAIVQDTQGYMWLGTQDGLQRYDGYNFITYRHDPGNPQSLADNGVTGLMTTPDGALWVGTQNFGLDRLMPGTDRFVHFQHQASDPQSLTSNSVQVLYVDHSAHLWVGTSEGLDRMDGGNGGFHHYRVPSSQPVANSILALAEDQRGRLWVGTEHGLYYYDAPHDQLVNFVPVQGLELATVHAIFAKGVIGTFLEANDHNLWIGSRQGLTVLDPSGKVLNYFKHRADDPHSLSETHVRALMQDASGDIWMGTTAGVSRYDPSSGQFSNYQHDATDPEGLNDNVIDTIYRDRTGLIWIGTDNAGADIYNPETRAFGYYRHRQGDNNSLADNVVWSMLQRPNGELWVATQAGLTRMDRTRTRYTQYAMGDRPQNRADDASVNVVGADAGGVIWAGTSYGLYRMAPDAVEFTHINLTHAGESRYGNTVFFVFWDSHKRFWVGTALGLVQFDGSRVVSRFRHDASRADSLPDDSVIAMCEGKDGRLWLATTNGLAYFDGTHDHFGTYHANSADVAALSDNNVQSCLMEPDGNLWVGTASGLDYLDVTSGKFKAYSVTDGLPSNQIYAILPADDGVWVSTTNGLSHFNQADRSFHNYGKSDGLQGAEFNGGSAYAASDGELMFGGTNGMNAFYPAHLVRSDVAPHVAITNFTRLGTPVALATSAGPVESVDVQYRQNVLSFEFAAFDYAAPGLNSFTFRLEGFDEDWRSVQGKRIVTYTNLDPGQYHLHVRASNHDGIWGTEEAGLVINVLPPPWRTWWAYLLYAALTFVSVALALKLYKRTIKREHDLSNEQQRRRWAEALHNLIQSVSALRDERTIAELLIDTLTNFIPYERAMFYAERDMQFALVASRGIGSGEQGYLENWPGDNGRIIARLRTEKKPILLDPEEAASLDGDRRRKATRNYLAVPLVSVSGTFRLLLVGKAGTPIPQQQMEIAAAMAKQVSVALDNAQLIKELENLATTDGLTRLYNRRHFMERAESEFERSRRYQRELSAFLLDADHFKTVNDTHGHEVGDRVLRVLASACRQSLRQLDVIGRYGGEEFVVLLPETSAALAYEAAERLRHEIEQLRIPTQSEDIRVTVSIGVATATSVAESVAALINEADRALYEAKRAGRNCVVAAGAQRKTV